MSILLFCVLMFVLYLLPGIVATWYSKSNSTAILLINIFFGWTILGWLVALALALKSLSGKEILKTFITLIVFVVIIIATAGAELTAVAS